MFDTYAPRVCLLQAQRYHMLGRRDRAIAYYEACRYISNPGSEIHLVARTSLLLFQLAKQGSDEVGSRASEVNEIKGELQVTSSVLYVATAKMLEAVTTESIQKSKSVFVHLGISRRA